MPLPKQSKNNAKQTNLYQLTYLGLQVFIHISVIDRKESFAREGDDETNNHLTIRKMKVPKRKKSNLNFFLEKKQ